MMLFFKPGLEVVTSKPELGLSSGWSGFQFLRFRWILWSDQNWLVTNWSGRGRPHPARGRAGEQQRYNSGTSLSCFSSSSCWCKCCRWCRRCCRCRRCCWCRGCCRWGQSSPFLCLQSLVYIWWSEVSELEKAPSSDFQCDRLVFGVFLKWLKTQINLN